MSEIKKEKSCGAILLRRTDQEFETLLVRQNQGHWCFPKGHVIGNETEEETAKREVLEETGLTIEIVDGFRESTFYSPEPFVFKEAVYFLAKPTGGELKKQEEEIAEVRWVSILEASALITFENDADLLKSMMRYIKYSMDEEHI